MQVLKDTKMRNGVPWMVAAHGTRSQLSLVRIWLATFVACQTPLSLPCFLSASSLSLSTNGKKCHRNNLKKNPNKAAKSDKCVASAQIGYPNNLWNLQGKDGSYRNWCNFESIKYLSMLVWDLWIAAHILGLLSDPDRISIAHIDGCFT